MKYRKKPVVIEAIQWNGYNWTEIEKFAQSSVRQIMMTNVSLVIHTLEGKMTANLRDWIIKDVKGGLYPCKPNIFEATYEKAE